MPTPLNQTPAPIRVAVVNAQPFVRAGLRGCLGGEEDLSLVTDGPDLATVLGAVETDPPAVMVLDDPALDALLAQVEQGVSLLANLVRQPALLLLTARPPGRVVDRALQAGVRGFVEQSDDPAILSQAVRRLALGETFIAPQILPRVMSRNESRAPGYADLEQLLSPRELEILRLTGQGLEAKEIAYNLDISARTVDVHRGNIRSKLGLDGVHTLMRYALVWEQSRSRADRLARFCAETRPLLLVEDDEVDVISVRRTLSQLRSTMPLQVVHNGEEALAWLRSPRHPQPFLILLDINMPRMNGHEFLAELRRDPVSANLPVVVLTTSQHDVDRTRLYARGIMAYLVKPTSSSEYVEMFRALADFWAFNTPPPEGARLNPPPADSSKGS